MATYVKNVPTLKNSNWEICVTTTIDNTKHGYELRQQKCHAIKIKADALNLKCCGELKKLFQGLAGNTMLISSG